MSVPDKVNCSFCGDGEPPPEHPDRLGHDFITKAEFDALANSSQFADGPHVSVFGNGPGEPYNPNRDLWGTLIDGRKVRSKT